VFEGDNLSKVASSLGIDERQVAPALQVALPALITAIQRNASSADGLSSLTRALDRDRDGSVLEDISGFLAGGGSADGARILGHILGDRQEPVASAVGRGTGLDAASVTRLLSIAAPLVLGALSRARRSQPGAGASLADVLSGAASQMQGRSPDLMSSLGRLLDANRDGAVGDDLARLAGALFSR
jgi:hypothetical protein